MYLGIDIGGSKTQLAIFNDKGRVIKKLKFKTNQKSSIFASDLEYNLLKLVKKHLLKVPELHCVVVAIAATCDSSYRYSQFTLGKALVYGNLPWKKYNLSGAVENCIKVLFKNHRVQLPKYVQKRLESSNIKSPEDFICPIFIQNDANLAAYYECKYCRGKSIYLTFSTGIGGGIMKDGNLVKSSDVFEPGHWKYFWKSKQLEYEDIAGAKAIEAAYGNKTRASSLRGKAVYQDMALRVSTGLADIIKQEKPDHIIVGGAIGKQFKNYRKYLLPLLKTSIGKHKMPDIKIATTPLESVIHGCYLYGKARC